MPRKSKVVKDSAPETVEDSKQEPGQPKVEERPESNENDGDKAKTKQPKSPSKKSKVKEFSTPSKVKSGVVPIAKLSPRTSVETSLAPITAPAKSPGAVPRTLIELKPETERVYKIVRKCSGALGGNGYAGAIYGELTMHSMQKVVNYLIKNCGLDSSSRFIDIGSGLGKPNFHVAQDPNVRLSIGIELEDIRWQLAMGNLQAVLEHTSNDATKTHDVDSQIFGCTNFLVGDVDTANSTDPFTHIYQFDLGFPPDLQSNIADKFNSSCHAEYLISYRPPHRVISEYGYEVELMDQVTTSMHGSGEGHTAYVYKRTNPKASVTAAHLKVKLPGRVRLGEADDEVVCDPAFLDAVTLAVGPLANLKEYVSVTVKGQLASGRPKRERKAPLRN